MHFWKRASWRTFMWSYMKFVPVVQEMLFKDISYLELWWPLFSAEQYHLCNFHRGYYEEQFRAIILNLDQWLRRKCLLKIFLIWSSGGPFVQQGRTICSILVVVQEMLFKDLSYLELWNLFCTAERNHLCNFGRGYYEEQYCEIILNSDQWFKRRSLLKIFLIWSSGSPFVQRSRTICAILVEGIMRNNSVK